jgi:Thioesterase domain/AMP-binding enzyme C-terminal domain/AMP-binding enzyme
MLYVGGPELFSEYYNDPELTASVLVDRGGERFYRTQDQVRCLPGGELQFIARADDLVKIRGFRVDLREVERSIALHGDVHACVVLAAGDARGGVSSLVAFVTPGSVESRDILHAVRDRLPSYMVPAAVVSLDAFPLTASGKVDRGKLLADFGAPATEATSAFTSETERMIARVWAGIVGHNRFSRTSSFFEIGGTSLNVFSVVHQLRTVLLLDRHALGAAAMYRFPAVGDLAAYVDGVRNGKGPTDAPTDTILVTLKRGADSALPPLFLISSAGGTLGAYTKLAKALGDERDVVGVRDPFLWGGRDPSQGFRSWVTQYVDAIRARQVGGPYYIAAYSSAGAFGYEIARRLRAMGHEVALLALIDPLALDRATKRRFGYWSLEARFKRPVVARVLRLAGQLRRAIPRRQLDGPSAEPPDWKLSSQEFERLAVETRNDRDHIRRLSALLELNTGLPFSLTALDVSAADSDDCQRLLVAKVKSVAPQTDVEMIERLTVQYELQVRSQHNYRLRSYDGTVCLFEPQGPYAGLESTQIRPYVGELRERRLPVGTSPTESTLLDDLFPRQIVSHYLCMRDDVFVARLASELDSLMRPR